MIMIQIFNNFMSQQLKNSFPILSIIISEGFTFWREYMVDHNLTKTWYELW